MDREFILQAIRRTAPDEDRPLGRKNFENETGIKEKDWKGIHWINWSDALIEAGFTPNKYNSGIDRDILLTKAAELVRELGHFPQRAELMMKRSSDPNFPDEGTFRRKFGKKGEFASELYAWSRSKDGWNDVENICDKIRTEPRTTKKKEVSSAPIDTGFVYLMKSGKHYKIGKTNSVDRRQYEIGLQLPQGIEAIHSIATDDPSGIETYWHNRFRDKRLNGEWFSLDPNDVRIFKRRKFM